MTIEKYRVAIIHNIISPYRIPLFVALAGHEDVDLTVYYCARTHKHRNWKVTDSDRYKHEVLPGIVLEFAGIAYHINTGIIGKIIRGDHGVIVIGGCYDLTMQLAYIAAKLRKKRVILWSEGTESARSLPGKLMSPATNHIVKNADAIIVPGALSRDFHVKMGADQNKVFIAPNIVDNTFYRREAEKVKSDRGHIKKQLNIDHSKVILFVGQLIERKGCKYLIQAFERLRRERDDVSLVIVGDGDQRRELEALVAEKNIQGVYFTGWISDEEKIKYYALSDLFVLPTLSDVWALVINEAMCCGLPVITTRSAGCYYDMVVPGENGYVVDAKNAEDLYLHIKKIFSNEDVMKRMGSRSLSIIQDKFCTASMVEGFYRSIEYAVSGRS